jgi:hypothetical protein
VDKKPLTASQRFNSKNVKKLASWYEHNGTPAGTQKAEKCIHYRKLEVTPFPEVEVTNGLCHKEFGLCILEKGIHKCKNYEERK